MLEFEELRKLINALDTNRGEIQDHLENEDEDDLIDEEVDLLETLTTLQDQINEWQEAKGLFD